MLAGGPEESRTREYEQHVEEARHLSHRQPAVRDGVVAEVAALAHVVAPLPLQRVQPPVLVQLDANFVNKMQVLLTHGFLPQAAFGSCVGALLAVGAARRAQDENQHLTLS